MAEPAVHGLRSRCNRRFEPMVRDRMGKVNKLQIDFSEHARLLLFPPNECCCAALAVIERSCAMASGSPSVCVHNEEAQLAVSTAGAKDTLEVLRESVSTLPRRPVEDLLSHGVCARCVLRLFSQHEQICSVSSMEASVLSSILYDLVNSEGDEVNNIFSDSKDLADLGSEQNSKEEIKVCSLCLGILQFMYNDEKGNLVCKDCPNNFTAAIELIVKQEGHQFDSFSLEVSLPQSVVEYEEEIWLYIKQKYSSESYFVEKHPSESIYVKEFLKMLVTPLLETLLGVRSDVGSSFRVRLTYSNSDSSAKNHHVKANNGFNKRRKTVVNGTDGNDESKKNGGCCTGENHDPTKNSSVIQKCDIGFPKLTRDKVNQCCSLTFQCYRTSIYIGGRYLKYSRNVSQTRWIIDDERKGEASVEEIVGGTIFPLCQGDNYKFHAAGREDIDVRMLGTGRPFLVEIQNARILPSESLIKNMENTINSLESKLVKVKKLKVLDNQGWDLMREGEAEKQKQYAALVWISRPLEDGDVQKLSSLKDVQILQKTPIRVLHRRSPLEREKAIHWMRIERLAGSSQYFLLHLCTQAGTYIKEFVHGDLGRTHPNVGSILHCRAEILQLDVTDVKMDWFHD
ncbi:uncharacterized protein LOC127257534 isoform X2 [Andrographis paniculata]|uniref:uncharacterized protein LOC127257534 isoform X2 n=1 Tax=Andrographis paniculata TaxID=175694 RepID=UPI0021E83F9A|nr:uncharacterized protein LOC127257534 isoform X2 [Andrographis paniculata]